MNAKEFLMQVQILDNSIQNIRIEILNIELKMTGLGDKEKIEKGKSSSLNTKSPQEIYYSKLEEQKQKLEKMCDERTHKMLEIIKLVERLSNVSHMQVLVLKFIRYKSFDEIATERSTNRRNVIKLYNRALNEFTKIYNEKIADGH